MTQQVASDTTLSNKLSDYLKVLTEEGFEEVLKLSFVGDEGRQESFFIFFHEGNGIILALDTFGGDKTNGGHFYYNWRPHSGTKINKCISSGSFSLKDKTVWIGDHDCRESLRRNLHNLRQHGTFVNPWIEQPFLWLLHYMDTKKEGYDYEAISAKRIALLPVKVQATLATGLLAKLRVKLLRVL